MATPNNPNKLGGIETQSGQERRVDSSKAESHEFKEVKNDVSSRVDFVDGIDEGGEVMGQVSEVLKEKASEQGGGGGKTQTAAQTDEVDIEKIKARLLQNLPSEKIIKKQIKREITKEIDYLHKKAMKMLRSPNEMNYFEMNNILKKIRELNGILSELIKASIDALKTLWLRFVHGIMS